MRPLRRGATFWWAAASGHEVTQILLPARVGESTFPGGPESSMMRCRPLPTPETVAERPRSRD